MLAAVAAVEVVAAVAAVQVLAAVAAVLAAVLSVDHTAIRDGSQGIIPA